MDLRMMNRKEVCAVLSISSSGLHRGMAAGKFPKPYRTGENSVRWKSTEVAECIDMLPVAEPASVAPGARRGRKPKAAKGE